LSLQPDNPALLAFLARVEYARGGYAEAMRLYGLASRLGASSAVLNVRRGEAAWMAGKEREAAEAWREAGRLAPKTEAAGRALSHMERAVALNPMEARLHLQWAEMLCDSNRPQRCLEEAREAERIDGRLLPESAERLRPSELRGLEMLKARARVLAASE
jgi:predicted Zn-dependent protease